MWIEAKPLNNADMKLSTALEIINDATANGFEFKIENGKIYCKEV